MYIYFILFFSFQFFIFLILKSLILTCVPKHEPPSHLPPHNISVGHPHAPAPSMLYPASDIDWRFNSYMIVYMLECHSPKSSHPLPLPLSPKVRYTHLSFFLSCIQGLMQKFNTGPPCSKILLTWPRQTDTAFPLADQHTQHSATSHPRDRGG